jgi:hypothetical protein
LEQTKQANEAKEKVANETTGEPYEQIGLAH